MTQLLLVQLPDRRQGWRVSELYRFGDLVGSQLFPGKADDVLGQSGIDQEDDEILMIQAAGDYQAATELVERYGTVHPAMAAALDRRVPLWEVTTIMSRETSNILR